MEEPIAYKHIYLLGLVCSSSPSPTVPSVIKLFKNTLILVGTYEYNTI